MTNQTPTVKCPTCSTLATQPSISEECCLARNELNDGFESLITTCVIPAELTKFYQNETGEDPCILCSHNQVTETPGSFLHMDDGHEPNTWIEIHLCPHCQSKYSVDTQTKTATIL